MEIDEPTPMPTVRSVKNVRPGATSKHRTISATASPAVHTGCSTAGYKRAYSLPCPQVAYAHRYAWVV